MPLFTRNDREAVGTAGVALGLVALMFGFFAFVVAAHADNRKVGAPAGAVQVTLERVRDHAREHRGTARTAS